MNGPRDDTEGEPTPARQRHVVATSSCSFPEFINHPLLYKASDGEGFHSLDGRPYTDVHYLPSHGVRQQYPNRATAWTRARCAHVCAASIAVYDDHGDDHTRGGVLREIDLLVRNEGASPLDHDASHYTAVFILQSGGSRTHYRRALHHVCQTRRVCHGSYGFHCRFLLLHITKTGVLRRRWV